MNLHTSCGRKSRSAPWGLSLAPAEFAYARRVEQRWRWPVLASLGATIPAFYAELLQAAPSVLAVIAYLVAAAATGMALVHTAWHLRRPRAHWMANALDVLLTAGLLAAALVPPSHDSTAALTLRAAVALLTLVRMVWALQHLLTRGSLAYLLLLALVILGLCGAGFWWLEPRTPTFVEGLWLAFTTAATVGYGDVVPSTPASKIFSVFVVLLGYGVLTLVTAAIAAHWVETEERAIEHEILLELHRQLHLVQGELESLRREARESRRPAL